MIYQVAIEEYFKPTATTPDKCQILVSPEALQANDANDAMIRTGAKHSKAILESKADYFKVSVKQF